MAKSKSVVWSMTLLGVLLILFPLGSFIYLKAGYDYRVDSLSELEPLGQFKSSSSLANTEPLVQVLVVSGSEASDSTGIAISKVHEAFDNQPLVRFGLIGGDQALLEKDPVQIVALASEAKEQFARLSSGDQKCAQLPINQRGLVVDTSGSVRRCYDMHSGKEVARLVEHLTILVPKPEKEDLVLSRKEEY